MSAVPLHVLITGGSGFLGRAIVDELRDRAKDVGREVRIRVLDRRAAEEDGGVEFVKGDITDPRAVRSAMADVDIVIHAASMVDWGNTPEAELERVNLGGTHTILAAAAEAGVRGFIYTSSHDVLFDGKPVVDADELRAYPERNFDAYSRTKTHAERAVLAADRTPTARGVMRTCALRPCGMYGERDPYHVGSFLRAARERKLWFRVGDGSALFSHVYVGNVAFAHALAAFKISEDSPTIAGRSYFITDQAAQNFFDFMRPILEACGYRAPERRIPFAVIYPIAALIEAGAALLRPFVSLRPALTRSSVVVLCHHYTVSGERARVDLGYSPRYAAAEAFDRTVAWFRTNAW